MNLWSILLYAILIGSWLIDLIVETLNVRNADQELPGEFRDVYNADRYAQSQRYLRENTRFGLIKSTLGLIGLIAVIQFGVLNRIDVFVRDITDPVILRGLLFAGICFAGGMIFSLPFSLYHTFVIEEKYGFNKTSLMTFLLDRIKGIVLGILLGAPVLAGIIWFFETSELAWLWAWGFVTLIQFIMIYLAPVLIMPLFNKYEELEDGELKKAVMNYADEQNFELKGVFTMDGSKRSSKANAFFTGFGKYRRIVLFDTLIEQQTVQELLAVLAHEMGHFKKKHIHKMMIINLATSAVMFWFISLLIDNPQVFDAFGMSQTSTYAGLLFIGILFEPISMLLSVFGSWLSRKHEYEADAYTARTVDGGAENLISALKKLSEKNLGNLTPHPLKVFLEYSHPPVLQRVKALRDKA